MQWKIILTPEYLSDRDCTKALNVLQAIQLQLIPQFHDDNLILVTFLHVAS